MATFEETFRQSAWKSSPDPVVRPVARQFWNAGAASRNAEVAELKSMLLTRQKQCEELVEKLEPMECGHPKACWVSKPNGTTAREYFCTACAETADLRSQVTRWKKAVEGLTAGGSEYVDNPEACAATIRQRMNVPKIVLDLRSKIEALSGQYQIEQARADGLAEKIEAARAWIEKWRVYTPNPLSMISETRHQCADQLEAALGKQGTAPRAAASVLLNLEGKQGEGQ